MRFISNKFFSGLPIATAFCATALAFQATAQTASPPSASTTPPAATVPAQTTEALTAQGEPMVLEPLDRAQTFAQFPLQPFIASYEVYNEGRRLGNATLQLVSAGNGRWRIDLAMRGTGLMRIAGLNAEQSVVFTENNGQLRPLSIATTQQALIKSRRTVGIYNWNTMRAAWRGDVRENRRDAVPLRDGDMNALLMNLAMIRDASPRVRVSYRHVENGRAREHVYQADAETVPYEVDGLNYQALHLVRGNQQDGTEIWVAQGVPTPLRILQHEDGKHGIDMRLTEYR